LPHQLAIGGLSAGIPFGVAVAYAAAFGELASLPLWYWPLAALVCVGFGALGGVGFTYDIVREVLANESGVVLCTSNRRLQYAWEDIEPRARVFLSQVRFKAHDGTVFFLTRSTVRQVRALPFGPNWNVEDLPRW
jgi:hypothetical protein